MDDRLELTRLLMALRKRNIASLPLQRALEYAPYSAFGMSLAEALAAAADIAHMMSLLRLENGERLRVLEIGTGNGFRAAVLAQLVRMVYTIDRQREKHIAAAALYRRLRLHNAYTRAADGAQGWKEASPFDRIIVNLCAAELPLALAGQIKTGGIMLIALAHRLRTASEPAQYLTLVERSEDGLHLQPLSPADYPPMIEGPIWAKPHSNSIQAKE